MYKYKSYYLPNHSWSLRFAVIRLLWLRRHWVSTLCYRWVKRMENPLKINKDLFYDIEKRLGSGIDNTGVDVLASQPDIIRGLNFVFLEAIKLKASDIHLEAHEKYYKIRFRIDGMLNEMTSVGSRLGNGLVSRIKVLSRLNISEKGLPQDGRFTINVAQETVELRVSVIPMLFGEGIVLRILDKSSVRLELANIGAEESDLQLIRESMKKTNGIILVTGPTGSGKTTTLYAIINELNQEDTRIVTTEDPVEYKINGIMQVEVKPDIGLTFASSLRSILRQDPDIILVGEIRDTETAKVAIESSLTGHLILSTIHTRDTVSTISRLVDMGVASYLLSDTIDLIIAQRLVRVICKDCRESYPSTEDEIYELRFSFDRLTEASNLQSLATCNPQLTFFRGKGCYKCNFTGYRGRTALFEIMNITDDERELIINMDIAESLYKMVSKKGMVTLREYGVKKMLKGITTFDEVMQNT